MARIRNQRGLMAQIARALGISRGAVAMWSRVPSDRLMAVARATGIPAWELRPDMYEAPPGADGMAVVAKEALALAQT